MTYTKQFCFLALLFILCACKKSVKPTENDPGPTVKEPELKQYLPVKLESDKLNITLSYAENTSRLEKITASDGYSAAITYKNDLPHRLDQFKKGVRFYFNDYLYVNKILNTVTRFTEELPIDTHQGNYELKYNALNQIQYIEFYDAAFTFISKKTFTYNQEGNLAALETTDKTDVTNSVTLTYDSKNGIFKHVAFADLLFLEMAYNVFCPAINNRLSLEDKQNPAENLNFTYQYNTDGYPSELVITKGKVKQTFKITYQELKP